ncbi:MAG: ABC transporter permease subunit [Pirellulaceae bacterium]
MPIHDLGYRSWDVPPEALGWRWLVIGKAGIRNAWKNKWLGRSMVLLLFPVVLVAVGIFSFEQTSEAGVADSYIEFLINNFFRGASELADEVGTNPDTVRHEVWSHLILFFFRNPQAVGMVMVVGLIAPRLIAQDVRSRAFLLYFSRPLTPLEYVLGKAMTIGFFLVLITTIPALVLYLLGIALSPSLSVVLDTYDLPIRIILASLVLIIPTTSLALCFSSLTSESRYAGYMWFATWILGWVLFSVMGGLLVLETRQAPVALESNWSLLSLYHTLGEVQVWVFGLQPNFSKVFPSLVLLIAITVISWSILMRRVTAPLRQ